MEPLRDLNPGPTTPPPPIDSPDPIAAILADFLHAPEPLGEIAQNHRLKFAKLADALDSERAQASLAAVRRLSALRADLVAAQLRVAALQRLGDIMLSADNAEVARRAAVWILRAATPPGRRSPAAGQTAPGAGPNPDPPPEAPSSPTIDHSTDESDTAPSRSGRENHVLDQPCSSNRATEPLNAASINAASSPSHTATPACLSPATTNSPAFTHPPHLAAATTGTHSDTPSGIATSPRAAGTVTKHTLIHSTRSNTRTQTRRRTATAVFERTGMASQPFGLTLSHHHYTPDPTEHNPKRHPTARPPPAHLPGP
ncbi:MAG: hypothetical protein ACK4WH_06260 [Phycisphaerales bacterium]